ncbi:Integrase [Ferrimonas sediminum]|uniref:Integrase n=1 Tax=Ferrimonas sediminum TaxID=718193 RepID=A0A1G8UZR2_9GAMM|nr:site-specific integrase [Ferrimonas sediminum]SDJ58430.1 Integrase [Ferrimonas sediminum]
MGKLYDKSLKAVHKKRHAQVITLTDGGGLAARVSKLGKVRWQFRYKINGKNKRIDFGDYPDLSLVSARDEADKCRTWLAEGYDPKHKRLLQRAQTLTPVTVEDALGYWLREYAEPNRVHADKHRAQFKRHIYPEIGALPLTECTTQIWLECFDKIRKGDKKSDRRPAPVAAGYIMQNAKQALRYCRVRHYAVSRALDDLTVADVGQRQGKRDRVLNETELRQLWGSAEQDEFGTYLSVMLKVLIIFGARSHEVRLSEWSEWDLKNKLWTVPKAHSKTDLQIIRPIPEQLIPWLRELRIQTLHSGYMLGELKRPEAVSQAGRLLWQKLKHAEKWTLHDLRRTLATNLNNMGVMPHVVEQLLGHSLGGVMAIYNRSQYLSEKETALELWFDFLMQSQNLESKPSGSASADSSKVLQFNI